MSETAADRIRVTRTLPAAQWNDLVTKAPTATVFHRYEFLETLADHTNTSFHPFVAVDGERPIGLFPVFERSVGPLSALFSPAPGCKVRYLGPVFFPDGPGADIDRHAFLEAALSCFETRFSPQYWLVRTTDRFADDRPFIWRGFESTPQYTYVVDLSPGREALLDSFSSDARSNIRADREELTITEGGVEAVEQIITQVRERHRQQGTSYPLSTVFVTDLYERMPEGSVRPYVVRADGAMVGGMVTLEDDATVYRWQGGAKPDTTLAVNECLDWHIMEQAVDHGRERYDLVGANKQNIARYKSKFDPDLVTFHSLVKSTRSMRLLASVYRRLR